LKARGGEKPPGKEVKNRESVVVFLGTAPHDGERERMVFLGALSEKEISSTTTLGEKRYRVTHSAKLMNVVEVSCL